MTCKELIKRLQKFPKDMRVVVSANDEGTSFQFLSGEYVSIEMLDENLNIYVEEDYNDDLDEYVCVG